jgi:hypothetical protein
MALPALDVARLKEDLGLFLRRTRKGDFQTEKATFAEREALRLARRPTTFPLAQDYVAWRRGVLWIVVLVLFIHAVFGLVSLIDVLTAEVGDEVQDLALRQAQETTQSILKWVMSLLYLRLPVALVLFFHAARAWTELKASRRAARQAWMVMVLAPVALSVIPFSAFTSADGLTEGMRQSLNRLTGLLVGLILVPQVAPIVVGLMNGVIRSSMVLKTLLPESAAPGWGVVFAAPVYTVVLLTMMVVVNQISGTLLLPLGLACLIAGPVLYLRSARDLVLPCRTEEVTRKVRDIRRRSSVFTGVGLALFFYTAHEHMQMSVWKLLDVGSALLASSLAFTLVGADFLLALISKSHRQAKAFHSSDLAPELDLKFEGLGAVGLLKLQTEPATAMMARPDLQAP